ncbi:MAG TPA: FAD-dependent oxidoreductase [Elainellaceae cyanobacterium]
MKKIVIIGAGPCGVLLAHYLLRRSANYQVEIYDRRDDPRHVEFPTHRSHSINLGKRGLAALSAIEGLEPAIRAKGIMSGGRVLHFKNGKTVSMQKRSKRLSINRNALVIAMLSKLIEIYDESRLRLHFNCKYIRTDFTSQTITFQHVHHGCSTSTQFETTYDVLVGADGVNSAVREQLQLTPGFEMERVRLPWIYKTLTLRFGEQHNEIRVAPRNAHIWKLSLFSIFTAIPRPDNSFSCVIGFHKNHNPLLGLSTPHDVLTFFHQQIGSASQLITLSEAEAFFDKPFSTISAIRCNRYHQGDRVIILGDAAHAISPLIGQGCNSSLEDVAILDRLLDEYADDWAQVLPQFSRRRQPDAEALFQLSNYTVPISRRLWIELLLKTHAQSFLHHRFPKLVAPSLLDSISGTTLPYSAILNRYQGWIDRVKQSNEYVLSHDISAHQPLHQTRWSQGMLS